MKTKETSTRTQALEWWKSINGTFKQRELGEDYCKTRSISVIDIPLTGREIEEIWRKETKDGSDREIIEEVFPDLKPNQKQYFQEELKGFDSFKQAVNAKQYKTFNESLFKAYIDKFTNNDLIEMYNILEGAIDWDNT